MRKAGVSPERRPYLYLALLTIGAVLVHGYHPGIEDAEIYIPGVKILLNPNLYSFGQEFFLNHAQMTFFDELIASTVRASPFSFDLTVLLWYAASLFLTLLACWKISAECFSETEARWAAVAMVAALLTIPVAGTSLYIADQYLTSRSLVTLAILFAIWNVLKGRRVMWVFWSIIAACVHPLMAAFGISYTLILWWMRQRDYSFGRTGHLMLPAIGFFDLFPLTSKAYQQAVSTRSYFFLLQWSWYEWLGALAPLLLLWLMGRWSANRSGKTVRVMSQALIVYGLSYLALAAVLTVPQQFYAAARLQPMRSLHLLYIMMFLFGGGLLGQYILKRKLWRWAALFLPICAGMAFAQRQILPLSPHIEWPNARPANDWVAAFEWIRGNTPVDALFAVDPHYMNKDDQHGFRAIAERSRLADAVKDSGAVTMFPELPAADHWLEQLQAESGWKDLQEYDFRRLKKTYGVSWVVSERSLHLNFSCPYQNQTVRVCRIE